MIILTQTQYTHRVTLLHRPSGDEQLIEITTDGDRFNEVSRAIHAEKVNRGLLGYEIFEVLTNEAPF